MSWNRFSNRDRFCRRSKSPWCRFRPVLEALEARIVLARFNWVGNNLMHNLWWANAENWTVGTPPTTVAATTPPGAGDDVYFDASSNAFPPLVQAATSIGSLHLLGTFTGEIDLKSNLTVGTTLGSEFLGGTIDAQGTGSALTINGSLHWTATTVQGGTALTTTGTTTVDDQFAELNNATWTNTGQVNVNTNGLLDVSNGGAVTNQGSFNVTGGPVTNGNGAASFTNASGAALTLANAFTTGTFTNSGTFRNGGGMSLQEAQTY